MCNHNYMDNVPVKIAENYKPPPRIYQLPQAIAHRLALPANYYQDAPQFAYDFELEHKVLAKLPEWQRVRQQEREARLERKQRREQLRLRSIEAQNKKMLGDIKYPDAEELSSTDSDEEEQHRQSVVVPPVKEQITAASIRNSNFDHILQPIILERAKAATSDSCLSVMHNHKISNFDYKDFEYDTSSPFDSVELKTINDLDILAQVLHNTQQLKESQQQVEQAEVTVLTDSSDQSQETDEQHTPNASHTVNEVAVIADQLLAQHVTNLEILEKTKAALEKIDFNEFNENLPQINKADIPYAAVSHAAMLDSNLLHTNQLQNGCHGNQTQQQQQSYNLWQNDVQSNTNFIYNFSNCNGSANNFFSPTHHSTLDAMQNDNKLQPQMHAKAMAVNELNLKSKSVPDILGELNDEVRRRNRNLSHNADDDEHMENVPVDHQNKQETRLLNKNEHPATKYFTELEATAQQLAKNISSMGFPLERVSKIMQIYGTDDKKIIEHLIPLGELVDLGFDETKISEALLKFNNNKEKALDYLIS